MNKELFAEVIAKYGLTPTKRMSMQKGYRNESYPFVDSTGLAKNLILYKDEPDVLKLIKLANRSANFVAKQGLPARTNADGRILSIKTSTGVRYAALYDYLPGQTIAWEAYTRDHIKLLGMTLAKVHAGLALLDASDFPAVESRLRANLQVIADYFADKGVQSALATKLAIKVAPDQLKACLKTLDQIKALQFSQVLHMDFVRGNVLFNSQPAGANQLTVGKVNLTGILDFEKTARGNPIYDLARSLAFLMVDCKYKTEAKVYKYFIVSGYLKRGGGRLNQQQISLIDATVNLFLLYDFYKFLLYNPYQSLPDNEHFVRTKNCLLARKVITAL
ncbi:MAG: phosphotransferase [Candidatus Saccharimonadales bacterium]